MKLDGSVAVVAVGVTEQGKLPGRDGDDIAIEALGYALDEAQIGKEALDGLITCKAAGTGAGVDTEVGRKAGLNPAFSATLDYGTCNFSLHLAAMAIQSGMADTIACLTARTRDGQEVLVHPSGGRHRQPRRPVRLPAHRGPRGTCVPPAPGALRHHRGAARPISVSSRAWAKMNPQAIFREDSRSTTTWLRRTS